MGVCIVGFKAGFGLWASSLFGLARRGRILTLPPERDLQVASTLGYDEVKRLACGLAHVEAA
jgi:hypothetical protein